MAKLITDSGRKAIKKIAEISQCARALSLMPTSEEFALRFIGELRHIVKRLNSINTRLNEVLDRYSMIPVEFLIKGFDEVLEKLNNINDYAKFAIEETANVMSSTVQSAKDITDAVGSAVSATTSAVLQVGGGLTYGVVAQGANLKLAMTGNDRRTLTNDVVQDVIDGKVSEDEIGNEFDKRIESVAGEEISTAESIKDWTENATIESTDAIDGFFDSAGEGIDKALNWIDEQKSAADGVVDDTIGALIEWVENQKANVEELIERVREAVDKLNKEIDDSFGFINTTEDAFRNASYTAYEKMDTPIYDAVGDLTGEIADFINNFSIGKVITGLASMYVNAGIAVVAMDLLPFIDVDRMMRELVSDIDTNRIDKMTELYNNKYYENKPDLLEYPDFSWRLSEADLEKYKPDAYNEYKKKYGEQTEEQRAEIEKMMGEITDSKSLDAVTKENAEKMKGNESALKDMRKLRRSVIRAKQVEKYKAFLNIEMDYLKKELLNAKTSLKNDWDAMMSQYKGAISEIKKFFTAEGYGGNESVDRCCDRINDDADQIVELCKNIKTEITNAVAKVPIPYAIGGCVDMPVHKILSFFEELKIIITFLRNLIRLGIDIISQISILAKIVSNGIQSFAEIMNMLKDIIGIDKILNMIEYLVQLFRPKVMEAKILLENMLSPVYYNETEEYEIKYEALEALLEDDKPVGNVEMFKYTDDIHAKTKYRNIKFGGELNDDEIEDALEELELKGEREIVAYRSPILNVDGDDFAGWIFYHPYAYDNMNDGWTSRKKRRRNKAIKKASRKNRLRGGKLVGGVAQLKNGRSFGKFSEEKSNYEAYYWYTKWTNDPTDCEPDFTNVKGEDIVSPIQTTSNGSLVELSDGRRVFVEGKNVKSGDFVNVDGVKYRVK